MTTLTFQFLSIFLAYFEGILPKGPYPPCLRMADRALLAGYPRFLYAKPLLWRPSHSSPTPGWLYGGDRALINPITEEVPEEDGIMAWIQTIHTQPSQGNTNNIVLWTSNISSPWATYQICEIVCCACAGNAGNVFPTTDFKGNH